MDAHSHSPNLQAQQLLKQLYAELSASGACQPTAEAEALLQQALDLPLQAALANVLAHHHFHAARYAQALHFAHRWRVADPQSLPALCSEISILIRLQRWEAVCQLAQAALQKHPEAFQLYSSLCNALSQLGRHDEARAQGTRCLELKDRAASGRAHDLQQVPVPPFNPQQRRRNVIAFSLYGQHAKYLQGALLNARAIPFIYPEWTARFYVDASVPPATQQALRNEGAEIYRVEGLPSGKFGTFWRFLVTQDAQVDRYLIRDCDSVVTIRERLAVEEWLQEGCHFHVMRDWSTHTELILAGMWGGVAGALPALDQDFIRFVNQHIWMRTLDQEFLREQAWPTVRQSVLVHDSHFSFGQHRDFPAAGRLPPGQHVGIGITI